MRLRTSRVAVRTADENARLIAAAPDLYAALLAYRRAWNRPAISVPEFESADALAVAALAKVEAEGVA